VIPSSTPQETAKKIVSMSKFAPVGTRGCGSPFTHHIFGVTEGEYEVQCNDHLLVIVQIESKSGVENVEEIAAVAGVDVLFVGESS
jgi:4-hydroxy-2-oxoheptanedioate aldolase